MGKRGRKVGSSIILEECDYRELDRISLLVFLSEVTGVLGRDCL